MDFSGCGHGCDTFPYVVIAWVLVIALLVSVAVGLSRLRARPDAHFRYMGMSLVGAFLWADIWYLRFADANYYAHRSGELSAWQLLIVWAAVVAWSGRFVYLLRGPTRSDGDEHSDRPMPPG